MMHFKFTKKKQSKKYWKKKIKNICVKWLINLEKMRYFENEILDKDQTIRELTGGLSKFDGL
jgi:hypothetical protein